ncbi:MAG: cell division protein ZapA [Candidatus Aminicenantes bacterium]|nr:cell division protein ZapA [Candidatus Aminicenantes bacterium]MDH5714535.1 cell division protein ZapA [Candidatus Aminicenantes bacterium]
MGRDSNLTEVEIYGQTYKIRGAGGKEYIQQLADYVDKEMKEISDITDTIDSLKVAILAAINIADEYFKTKKEFKRTERVISEKIERLIQKLEQVTVA